MVICCKWFLLLFLGAESVFGFNFNGLPWNSNRNSIPVDRKYEYHTSVINHTFKYKYSAAIQTTVIQPPDLDTAAAYRSNRHRSYVVKSNAAKRTVCLKCPSEQILVAQKGTDGVLIDDLPTVTSCSNKALPGDVYKFQSLLGTTKRFFLSQGSHSFLVKIVNSTGGHQQTCSLKYRVMVHRCPPYVGHNRKLRMKCTLDNLWGSTCTFTCKDGGYATNQPSNVYCNDHLEWVGEEPYCHYKNDHIDTDSSLSSSCDTLAPPKHGTILCGSKKSVMDSEVQRLPEGSICRVRCNRQFEVPFHIEKYSIFSCSNGHWNSTMMEFCRRSRR